MGASSNVPSETPRHYDTERSKAGPQLGVRLSNTFYLGQCRAALTFAFKVNFLTENLPRETLAPIGIMGCRLRTPLKPLNTIECCVVFEGFPGKPQLGPVRPRDASLSDGYTCTFFQSEECFLFIYNTYYIYSIYNIHICTSYIVYTGSRSKALGKTHPDKSPPTVSPRYKTQKKQGLDFFLGLVDPSQSRLVSKAYQKKPGFSVLHA